MNDCDKTTQKHIKRSQSSLAIARVSLQSSASSRPFTVLFSISLRCHEAHSEVYGFNEATKQDVDWLAIEEMLEAHYTRSRQNYKTIRARAISSDSIQGQLGLAREGVLNYSLILASY